MGLRVAMFISRVSGAPEVRGLEVSMTWVVVSEWLDYVKGSNGKLGD